MFVADFLCSCRYLARGFAQIEAADKKYKATSQFLEEQASEREQERDEAQREIEQLRDQLREREKDRASCERVNSEVCDVRACSCLFDLCAPEQNKRQMEKEYTEKDRRVIFKH